MISVDEALALIDRQVKDYGTETVALEDGAGRILAEDILADRDFPPYDRVTMDGIAIAFEAFRSGRRTFPIAGIQPAGSPQQRLSAPDSCLEVMTGAILPEGTDTVIPYEDCLLEAGAATVLSAVVRQHQHIHFSGTDSRQGAQLLQRGKRISPAMTGIMATVGKAAVRVQRLPAIAILSTGDELVDIEQTPLPYQIRRSNNYMLEAALHAEGIRADSYHLPDEPAAMQRHLAALLARYDVLLASGAVSKGKYDFLPGVLEQLGMQTVFHRIAQKPGKPFLLGHIGDRLVFGFPGNPVSTLVCYAVFFRRWLHRCLKSPGRPLSAVLSATVEFRPALTYHLPVKLNLLQGKLMATPYPGANSGDMVHLEQADAVLSLPAGQERFEAGTAYPLTLLSSML